MPRVFDWAESPGTSVDVQPRVVTTQFGDGYAARAADGLNPVGEAWDLVFRGCAAESADSIEAFLRVDMGIEPFDWTPPRQTVAGKFVCTSLRRTGNETYGEFDLAARFERVFVA
jgi:phage-related protein